MGQGDRGDYSGAHRCPRGVEKVMVILASIEMRGREAIDFTPRSTFIAIFTNSCPVAIFECQDDIFEAEV